MFSRRLPDDLRVNTLARARARLGGARFDLTVSNPTLCGIDYPPGLLDPLADPGGLGYQPDPQGDPSAREAVAEDYRRRGVEIDPSRVVLTASTSEAYGLLFKLLCDPGDEVWVPRPSYPLLEHLATLEGVRVRTYRLDPDADWQPGTIEISAETRAIVAVNPNNPTGSLLDRPGREFLASTCLAGGCALIADEVFIDFTLEPGLMPESFARGGRASTFVLGGLSKSIGMPQLKLAWIVACGPDAEVREALERLAFISDNYLSVNTPVQRALPRLLRTGAVVRERIRERCRFNLARLTALVEGSPLSVLFPRAGWSAVLRFPRTTSDESLALQLLVGEGVAVHPGFFFDFEDNGYLVVSLLPPPVVFEEGVRRLVRSVAAFE